MRTVLFIIVLLILHTGVSAQTIAADDLIEIRSVADNILSEHSHTLIDASGKEIDRPQDIDVNGTYKIKSKYLEWRYVNGLLYQSMLRLADITGESKYRSFVIDNYRFLFDNCTLFQNMYDKGNRDTGFYRFLRMGSLDDCGSMVAALIDVYKYDKRTEYRDYIDRTAHYIMQEEGRLPDGTFSRGEDGHKTVWLDDLYMSVSFLANMGQLTTHSEYFDMAIQQVFGFTDLLYETRTGLYYHCYYDYLGQPGVAHWGRANGWCIFAQTLLLERLPKTYPEREKLLYLFRQQVLEIARYQGKNGMWHQLLDKNDSYDETSCSAMFAYAIAKGVNEGWLDKEFSTIALRAWEGIRKQVTDKGLVSDICIGTGISHDLLFYYERPTPINDVHGLGAVIQAGIEVGLMKK